MSQNIYDDPEFFDRYSQLPRSVEGLAGAGEWPALRNLLPPLDGAAVLDLGCGFGWFCRWALANGAASVVGLDVSENMLARAAADTPRAAGDARIEYRRADLEEVELPPDRFDLVYSSLTLHYVRSLERLVGQIARALVPGGTVVCSVEHPTYTAPTDPEWIEHRGHRAWPLDGYLREGERVTDWLKDGVVKQHRTVASYVGAMLDAGLRLTALVEWGPSAADLRDHPEWDAERDRSPFMFLSARRDGQ